MMSVGMISFREAHSSHKGLPATEYYNV